MLLEVSGCLWAVVGFRVVRDEYEASVAFPFHVAEEVLEVTFEFFRPSMRVDVVA